MKNKSLFTLRLLAASLLVGAGSQVVCPAMLAAKETTTMIAAEELPAKSRITECISLTQGQQTRKPNIKILATGGTIAGTGASAVKGAYQAGQVAIGSLLQAVPQLNGLANVTGEQVVNIGSQHMTDEVMLRLAKRVNELMNDPQTDGIVITHGTDTMEETAFFLSLTTRGDKPVILVGSMRPSTALSADGPMNLYQAVLIATSPESQRRGVLVAMNGSIYPAEDVMKTHTSSMETFQAPNKGAEGYLVGDEILYYSTAPATLDPDYPFFDISKLESLPKTAILYGHSNIHPDMLQPILQGGYKGLVYAGVGNGNFHKNLVETLAEISRKGIQIIRAARVPFGPVTEGEESYQFALPVLHSGFLNPQKSRILLMLSLAAGKDARQIQEYFNEF